MGGAGTGGLGKEDVVNINYVSVSFASFCFDRMISLAGKVAG